MTRATADILLLSIAAIWGAAFVGQATAMAHMGPFTFTGERFLLAALAVLPFAIREGRTTRRPIPRRRALALIGIGAVFFGGSASQQVGLLTTSVTNAGFLTALYVVMVPALTIAGMRLWPRFQAPVDFHGLVWPAAALSLLGTFLLGGGRIDGLNGGDGLVILGAIFWAIQILALGALAIDLGRPVTIALMQYAVTAVLGLGAGFAFESPSVEAAISIWPTLVYTGVISGGLAFTLQAVAQAHTPPADAAILVSMEGLFAALFGALLLGERLPPIGWMGAGLLIAAALLVQLGPSLRRKRVI
jgi:drug/metabolite transporter (DMT)-like permease